MKKRGSVIASILVFAFLFLACKDKDDLKKEDEPKLAEVGSGETGGYKLVWEDLFNDTELNTNNWLIEVNGDGGGNSELQYYKRENISLGKEPNTNRNCLIITAQKENYKGKPVTSGRLNSNGKKSFKYGKIEASIKLPKTADGLWPAFWMLGSDFSNVGWPKSGEMDILEMGNENGILNKTQDKYFNGALHWGPQWDNMSSYAKAFTSGYGLQDDFHLYTLIWDNQTVKMYLDLDKYPDAKPYFEMNINDVANEKSAGNYFHKEFFIVFNLAVGGNFTKIWDINKVTALNTESMKMFIDYVKVYQKN